jgi:hypothetical protein
VVTNRDEQRVNRHRKRKKNVGELPHITDGPLQTPPGQQGEASVEYWESQRDRTAGQCGDTAIGIPRYATIRPSDPLEAR